jgi:hypothetical protein
MTADVAEASRKVSPTSATNAMTINRLNTRLVNIFYLLWLVEFALHLRASSLML